MKMSRQQHLNKIRFASAGERLRSTLNVSLFVALNLISASAISSERWVVQERASAIDGPFIQTMKGYRFPDSNAYFIATLKCIVESERVEMTVGSYVYIGDDVSARLADSYMVAAGLFYRTPIGRAKASSSKKLKLGDIFSLTSTSSSTIVLDEIGLHNFSSRIPEDLRGISDDAINRAGVIRNALPLALELNNSSGKYEIVIDASPEVNLVLHRCGGNEEILDPKEVEKFRATRREMEEKRQNMMEEMKRREEERQAEPTLISRYAAAIQNAILRNWKRPGDVAPGQRCRIVIRQLPGGEVIDAKVDPSCSFDEKGRRSIEAAVLKSTPLPYTGFEDVFNRILLLNFEAR